MEDPSSGASAVPAVASSRLPVRSVCCRLAVEESGRFTFTFRPHTNSHTCHLTRTVPYTHVVRVPSLPWWLVPAGYRLAVIVICFQSWLLLFQIKTISRAILLYIFRVKGK